VENHIGLPGVFSGITILDNTADAATINAALSDSNIWQVWLKPGSYSLNTQITIPAQKTLKGLSQGYQDGAGSFSNQPIFAVTHTGTIIQMNAGSHFENCSFFSFGSTSSSPVISCSGGGPNWIRLNNISMDFGGTQRTGEVIDAQNANMLIENISLRRVSPAGSNSAINLGVTSGFSEANISGVCRNVHVDFQGGGGAVGTRKGIFCSDGQDLTLCSVTDAPSHAFHMNSSTRNLLVFACRAANPGGDGFWTQNVTNGMFVTIHGCKVFGAGGVGFRSSGTLPSLGQLGTLSGNAADGSAGGNYITGGGWVTVGNNGST
jgi:hypothetical protein